MCVYMKVTVCDRAPSRRSICYQIKGSERKTDAGVCLCSISLSLFLYPHLYIATCTGNYYARMQNRQISISGHLTAQSIR